MTPDPRIAAIARFPATRAAAIALYDGAGGASLTAPPAGVAADTRIATSRGEAPAADLRAGDLLACGRRVIAVSRRTLDPGALARDADARPVCIAAGAIAEGVPARPLTVGPAQRLRIEGALAPAAALVNGASVTRTRPDAPVTYISIRLDAPACFLAEGATCDGFGVSAGDPAAVARIRGILDARAALERGALDGDVATVDHGGAYGWALDRTHPSAPVALEFVAAGLPAGHALAEVRRPDLEVAGLGDGRCGFLLRLRHRLPAGRPTIVALRRSGDGAAMPGTPILLPAATGGPAELAAALAEAQAAAANDASHRATLANELACAIGRLLQARGERPPPPAPAC
jgi:hypothetical protein